jgi:adenosylcobinamide kinase / adenosylcobinamide-phosphate guanylyltransferase
MSGTLTLVLGGVRSGKSRFAEQLASELTLRSGIANQYAPGSVLYIATAQAHDSEMKKRIAHHQASRPRDWVVHECTSQIATSLRQHYPDACPRVMLLECLTLLITNRMCEIDLDRWTTADANRVESAIHEELDALLAFGNDHETDAIIVSGEVGLGVVPESRAGRAFRDLLGRANQRLASQATAAYMMFAGKALPLHLFSHSPQQVAEMLTKEMSS